MSEYRNLQGDNAKPEDVGTGYRVVPQPARTDGVGQALRNAFGCVDANGVAQFDRLLQELDCRTRKYEQ